jgi:hypothetical protein
MVIKMTRTHAMPFGCFNKDEEYDTDRDAELSVGQALTFVACGSAIDVTPYKKKAKRVSKDGTD